MTIGERIKKLRQAKDLTQQEFCDRIGYKRNSISLVESGKRNISDQAIKSICREFNASEKWLLSGEGEMFVPAPGDTLDAFIRERNLTTTDRILIEKFVSLSVKARWEVVRYVLDIADALWEECKTSVQQRTEVDTTGQEQTEVDVTTKVAELERQNQELAARIAALEEEDALLGLTDASSKSPSVSVGNFSPAQKAKRIARPK